MVEREIYRRLRIVLIEDDGPVPDAVLHETLVNSLEGIGIGHSEEGHGTMIDAVEVVEPD